MKILIFFTTFILFSESNSNYRQDQNLYGSFQRRELGFENRFDSSQKKLLLTNDFNSTKGGNPSDLAREYKNQSFVSPELTYSKNLFNLVFAPNIKFSEKYNLVREKESKFLPELVLGKEWILGSQSINLELGRGFQRFDSYGIFFNSISNFIDLSFIIKEKFKVSFLAFEQPKFNLDSKIGTGSKFFGVNFLFKNLFLFDKVQFFYFQKNDVKQISEKRNFDKDIEFIPKSKYNYFTIELKTKPVLPKLNFELGIFYQEGKKYLNEHFYEKENQVLTKSNLFYLVSNLDFIFLKFRLGGIYSKVKNKNSFEDNSYFITESSPRIFGGNSSFLISESFRLEETNRKSNRNSGFQILNFSLIFQPIQFFKISFLFNIGQINDRYNGFEPILIFSILNEEKFFLNFSYSVAKLNDLKRNLSYNEFQLEDKKLEFNRVFFSAGVLF